MRDIAFFLPFHAQSGGKAPFIQRLPGTADKIAGVADIQRDQLVRA